MKRLLINKDKQIDQRFKIEIENLQTKSKSVTDSKGQTPKFLENGSILKQVEEEWKIKLENAK